LGQLFKITLELKKYFWQKLKLEKTYNLNKATTNKQVVFSILEVGTTTIATNNHMAIIQV
jgi:fumarate reductase subunit C